METVAELLQRDVKSLGSRVVELKRELLNLRLQHRSKELKDVNQISRVRRDVARVKTALSLLGIQKRRG